MNRLNRILLAWAVAATLAWLFSTVRLAQERMGLHCNNSRHDMLEWTMARQDAQTLGEEE